MQHLDKELWGKLGSRRLLQGYAPELYHAPGKLLLKNR